MTRLLLTHLAFRGCKNITTLNRSLPQPNELKEKFSQTHHDMEIEVGFMNKLWDVVGWSDIVFTDTSHPEPLYLETWNFFWSGSPQIDGQRTWGCWTSLQGNFQQTLARTIGSSLENGERQRQTKHSQGTFCHVQSRRRTGQTTKQKATFIHQSYIVPNTFNTIILMTCEHEANHERNWRHVPTIFFEKGTNVQRPQHDTFLFLFHSKHESKKVVAESNSLIVKKIKNRHTQTNKCVFFTLCKETN